MWMRSGKKGKKGGSFAPKHAKKKGEREKGRPPRPNLSPNLSPRIIAENGIGCHEEKRKKGEITDRARQKGEEREKGTQRQPLAAGESTPSKNWIDDETNQASQKEKKEREKKKRCWKGEKEEERC